MFLKRIKFLLIISFLLVLILNTNEISSKSVEKRGIIDNVSNGLKYAGQMLGIKTAADVAELVSKAFTAQQKQDNTASEMLTNEQPLPMENPTNSFNPARFFSGMLRLMGFDTRKLGALAINGIIFIAQMIGNTLIGRRRPQPAFEPNGKNQHFNMNTDEVNEIKNDERSARKGSPLDWILENTSEELQNLLKEMQDKKLPEYLTEAVQKFEKEQGEGDCVKQLLCKTAPFIWSMQRSVLHRMNNNTDSEYKNPNINYINEFFKYLPDVGTFKRHGYLCEEKYSACNNLQSNFK